MHLQHARGKHVVFVSILDERMDDFNRKVFVPQIEGAKTAAELPGIVDEVVTLAEMKAEDGSSYRAFVTQTMNPYGYQGVPVGTIKKHATGKGNAGKEEMILAVRQRGHSPSDDNEADALAILHWAIETQEV